MSARLVIDKRMLLIHGKLRPVIAVKAHILPAAEAFLLEHFPNETLFKRTAYAGGFADGGLQPSPPLSRMLSGFTKNDACPEITVKTLLAGQKYEGTGVWDIQCFDFIAKRAFDALCELAEAALSFATPGTYYGFQKEPGADELAFLADTAAERGGTAPVAVAVGGVQGMANAA